MCHNSSSSLEPEGGTRRITGGITATEFRRVLRPGGLLLMAFQDGVGERVLTRPYGHDVEMRAFLHHGDSLSPMLVEDGFESVSCAARAPRDTERHPQGFTTARATEDTDADVSSDARTDAPTPTLGK